MTGEFSKTWFDTFLSAETAAPVYRELEFIAKHMPVREFPRLLDVPCGIGRHAAPLSGLGYDIVGVDRDPDAIKLARDAEPRGATFKLLDIAELDTLPAGEFDGVLCLWQSFGYGSAEENFQVLQSMTRRLRRGGRILLDIYNADALRHVPPESVDTRAGRTIHTRRSWSGNRFGVKIRYSDSADVDEHDWLVYSPNEIRDLGAAAGLSAIHSCAWFDPAVAAASEHQRMQLLFEFPGPQPV